MPAVQTVLGSVSENSIHHAQCHEHIWLNKGKSYEINPVLCIDDFEKSLIELKSYKKAGGDLIVDAQPVGCGRNAKMLAELSRNSGVSIVASTGFHKLMFYPDDHWIHSIGGEAFSDLMVREITEGMFEDGDDAYPDRTTDFKAGMIKMACDKEGLTDRYLRLYKAAAGTSKMTGAPIQCHIEAGGLGEQISDCLISEGVSPVKIILAHMDRAEKDFDRIVKVLEKGVYLQFDTIGRYKYHSDEAEIELVGRLIEKGYGERLLIGLDTTRARLLSYQGEIGLTYILKTFIPMLREAGFKEEMIERILNQNPNRALSIKLL